MKGIWMSQMDFGRMRGEGISAERCSPLLKFALDNTALKHFLHEDCQASANGLATQQREGCGSS